MDQSNSTVIRAAVGVHFKQVIASSTFQFDPARLATMKDTSSYVVEEPFKFIYNEPSLRFTLDPGRLLWISTAAGRVWEIQLSPHLEALDLQIAHEAACRTSAAIISAGWGGPLEPETTRDELAYHFSIASTPMYSLRFHAWEAGETRLVVSIKRLRKAAAPEEADRFILDVRASNKSLYDRLMRRVREERRRRQGDENKSLPFEVWMTELAAEP